MQTARNVKEDKRRTAGSEREYMWKEKKAN
jgi:hypothetical protein